MLLQQAKYSAAHVHLLRAIDRGKTDESPEDLPEYRPIRLMLARAEMPAKGMFRRAKDCMDETRIWLEGLTLEDCTDLHVPPPQSVYIPGLLTVI